jgi:hypothetical protein
MMFVSFNSNTTGVTSGAEHANTLGVPGMVSSHNCTRIGVLIEVEREHGSETLAF